MVGPTVGRTLHLGHEMVATEIVVDGRLVGLNHSHPDQRPEGSRTPPGSSSPGWCLGYVGFEITSYTPAANHRLVSADPLEVAPSLQCPRCGLHGHIRGGQWEPV